jgi:hypothetical protein
VIHGEVSDLKANVHRKTQEEEEEEEDLFVFNDTIKQDVGLDAVLTHRRVSTKLYGPSLCCMVAWHAPD